MKPYNSKNSSGKCGLLLLFFVPVLLTGCWSAKEIHDLAIINAIGVDVNDRGEYEVTTAIAKPSTLFSQPFTGETGGNRENNFLIKTSTGKTIFEAMGKLSNSITESIYLGHVDVVVYGERAAKEKMESSLDIFHRDIQIRPNTQILVTKGKASDVISTTPQLNTTIGLEVLDITKSNRYAATKMARDMAQFKKEFNLNTMDPITAAVTTAEKVGVTEKGEDQKTEIKQSQKKKKDIISLDGTAVFKEGNLKGFLNERETRGLLGIKGELEKEIMVLNCEEYDPKGQVSVIITKTNARLEPEISEKKNEITVKTHIEANVGEVTCPTIILDSNKIEQLNRQLEKIIFQEEKAVLEKVQKRWQSDIFGFGEAIYRKYPHDWDLLVSNWRKGGIKDLQVNLEVKANISQYGLRKNPSYANESR